MLFLMGYSFREALYMSQDGFLYLSLLQRLGAKQLVDYTKLSLNIERYFLKIIEYLFYIMVNVSLSLLFLKIRLGILIQQYPPICLIFRKLSTNRLCPLDLFSSKATLYFNLSVRSSVSLSVHDAMWEMGFTQLLTWLFH